VRALSTALPSRQPSVVIADDSTVAREGLVAIIRRDLGYTVCGLATDERATRELTERHRPDLLVIEPFLGHHDGIFLLKQLATRCPRARILAVSRQPEEIYAERALRAGASGYWMKTSTRGGRGPRERKFAILRINLSPASVVWHCYLHLLVRGVAATVGAGDGNCIDASIAIACSLGSK